MAEQAQRWLQLFERRMQGLERDLAAVEAVAQTYEQLLDVAWNLIEELRRPSGPASGRDAA